MRNFCLPTGFGIDPLFIQAYQRYLKKDKDENTNELIDRHKKPDTFVSGFVLLPLLGSNQGPSD